VLDNALSAYSTVGVACGMFNTITSFKFLTELARLTVHVLGRTLERSTVYALGHGRKLGVSF
jgi:hypothetical protein